MLSSSFQLSLRVAGRLVAWSLLVPALGAVAQPAGGSSAAAESPTGDASSALPPVPQGSPDASGAGSFGTPEPPLSTGSEAGLLSVRPQSLMSQRLHEAAFPAEAEIRCFLATSCEFGLSRGFAVGSDLGAVIGTPIVRPLVSPGRWLVLDAFVGYQFLRAVDENVYFNAGIGWRSLSYKDSDDRQAGASGLTFRVAYAQRVLDFYSQGVSAQGFYATNKADKVGADLRKKDSGDERFLSRYYKFSHGFPSFRLGFPADFEFINWKNTHIDLPNHLRGYGRIEPFFIQNQFKESFPEVNEYSLVEQNVGLRLAYSMTYVSAQERFGRIGLLGGLGVDVQTSDQRISYDEEALATKVSLPKRPTLAPYWEIGGSFQF